VKRNASQFARWLTVVIFAVAMAWVESAVVLYLRTLMNRIEPYQPVPLPQTAGLSLAEVIREFATLVMLGAVGWLAGSNRRTRLGYFLIGFGVWDIFYYVFLLPLTGWPRSLLAWDILFLIPLPWWGPVMAPMLIAGLMILFGTLVTQREVGEQIYWPGRRSGLASVAGMGLALYVFMADAIRIAPQGERAWRAMLPSRFNWPLFLLALALMAAPILRAVRLHGLRRQPLRETGSRGRQSAPSFGGNDQRRLTSAATAQGFNARLEAENPRPGFWPPE
jgi:hypothetical protein